MSTPAPEQVQNPTGVKFTNATRPPTPKESQSGFFNEGERPKGAKGPVLSSNDDLHLSAPVYLKSPGEIQRFAEYFNDFAYADPTKIPDNGTVFSTQIRLDDLKAKSKKLSSRTTATTAGAVLVKLVKKFLPTVFPANMAGDLVETQLGLRTDAMQADPTRLLERVISYAHVIQLCVENQPPAGSNPHEFPLVVMPLSEFIAIDYDVNGTPEPTFTTATPKKLTTEEEIDLVMDSLDNQTQPANPQALAQAAAVDLSALQQTIQQSFQQFENRFKNIENGLAQQKRTVDRTLEFETSLAEEEATRRAQPRQRTTETGGYTQGNLSLYGKFDSLVTTHTPRTIEQQTKARENLLDVGKFNLLGFKQEILDKLRMRKTIRLDWVFAIVTHSASDNKVSVQLADGELEAVRASEQKAKIRNMKDLRVAYDAFLTCLKIYQPVLGQAFMESFGMTIDATYDFSDSDIITTKMYVDELINGAITMNELGQGADLSFSHDLFIKVKIARKAQMRDKKPDKPQNKHHADGKNVTGKPQDGKPKKWAGQTTDQCCRNWAKGVQCAFQLDNGKCPFKHKGEKGAGEY